jgi:hypothetical protein
MEGSGQRRPRQSSRPDSEQWLRTGRRARRMEIAACFGGRGELADRRRSHHPAARRPSRRRRGDCPGCRREDLQATGAQDRGEGGAWAVGEGGPKARWPVAREALGPSAMLVRRRAGRGRGRCLGGARPIVGKGGRCGWIDAL